MGRDDVTTVKTDLQAGLVLDGFELIGPLGRGGMGEVWRATDRAGAGRPVVLKFVPPEIQRVAEELDRVREMFTLVHAMKHPHICQLYGMRSAPGVGEFLIMEFLDGMTLSVYGRRGIFPPSEVLRILRPIAEALDYAHREHSLIHRDVKPSNIMMVPPPNDPEGASRAQLIDFGLASEIRISRTRVSNDTGAESGTNLYKSPEQWRSLKQTEQTDQYSLAVVAYEMLSGEVPFYDDNQENLRHCVVEESPEPLEPPIPPEMNSAILRALSKKRADRFATCVEFIDAMAKRSPPPPPPPPPPVSPPVEWENGVGLKFRRIESGSFMMGSPLSGVDVLKKYPT